MSTSRSSCSKRFSRRLATLSRSSTTCLDSSLSGRWAAMVSARRPASSMLEIEVRISDGIFLLSLTYWSNCCITARRRASSSMAWAASRSCAGSIGATCAMKWLSPSRMLSTLARCPPSTSTFTVPSGSFSICRMVATQPISNMSSVEGSSLAATFWATSMIRRSASMADSRALMLLGRPTNRGITMCGNTTTSRRGNSGRSTGVLGRGVCPDMINLVKTDRWGGRARLQARAPWG